MLCTLGKVLQDALCLPARAVAHLFLLVLFLLCPGQSSTRDEQGACAVLSTHLNSLLGERPIQYREVQGNESDVFMEYFPRGIKYQVPALPRPIPCLPLLHVQTSPLSFAPALALLALLAQPHLPLLLSTPQEGGVESAFHKTQPSARVGPIPTRKLYQVKGKKNIRAIEQDLSWASFNTGDCFILDLGEVRGGGRGQPMLWLGEGHSGEPWSTWGWAHSSVWVGEALGLE